MPIYKKYRMCGLVFELRLIFALTFSICQKLSTKFGAYEVKFMTNEHPKR